MVKMQQTWFCAVRRICDSERGTILCEVAATGAKVVIRYKKRLELVRVADGFRVALEAKHLSGLLVTEATAEALEAVAAEIEAEQSVTTHMALWSAARQAAKSAGRWRSSGQFRTHGAVGR